MLKIAARAVMRRVTSVCDASPPKPVLGTFGADVDAPRRLPPVPVPPVDPTEPDVGTIEPPVPLLLPDPELIGGPLLAAPAPPPDTVDGATTVPESEPFEDEATVPESDPAEEVETVPESDPLFMVYA